MFHELFMDLNDMLTNMFCGVIVMLLFYYHKEWEYTLSTDKVQYTCDRQYSSELVIK